MAGGPLPLTDARPRVDWWALAAVVAPGAVLVAQAARLSVGPWGDQAAIQLSVDRALHGGQLVGPYSRFRWSHPGPIYFYLLAGPYRALGSTPRALLVASVLLTVVAAGAVVVAAGLLGGTRAARWSAAVVTAELAALGPGIVSQVWNPVATIVPTTLFLICCAGLAAGRWWSLVGVVAAGSFLVQTDVSTGLVVAAVALAALAVAVVRTRSAFRARPAIVAIAVVVALWLAPVWQQATGHPGNLSRLLDFFRTHTGTGHSLGDAARAVAGALWPPLRGRLEGAPPGMATSVTVLVCALALAAGLVVIGWRWRRPLVGALGGAAGLSVLAGVVSAMRVTGPLFAYLVEWLSAATAVLVLGVLLLVGYRVAAGTALGVGAIALGVVGAVQPPRVAPGGAQVDALWAAARPELPGSGSGPIEVALAGSQDWPWGAGVLVDATHAGYRAVAQRSWLFLFGTQFTPGPGSRPVVWVWRPGTDRPPSAREVGRAGGMAVSVSLPAPAP